MHNWNIRKREKAKEIFEVLKAENFPRLMTGTKPKIQEAENTKQDKYKYTNINLGILSSGCKKSNTKKILKSGGIDGGESEGT